MLSLFQVGPRARDDERLPNAAPVAPPCGAVVRPAMGVCARSLLGVLGVAADADTKRDVAELRPLRAPTCPPSRRSSKSKLERPCAGHPARHHGRRLGRRALRTSGAAIGRRRQRVAAGVARSSVGGEKAGPGGRAAAPGHSSRARRARRAGGAPAIADQIRRRRSLRLPGERRARAPGASDAAGRSRGAARARRRERGGWPTARARERERERVAPHERSRGGGGARVAAVAIEPSFEGGATERGRASMEPRARRRWPRHRASAAATSPSP